MCRRRIGQWLDFVSSKKIKNKKNHINDECNVEEVEMANVGVHV